METVVKCSECGGVIVGETAEGLVRCTCNKTQPSGPLPGMPDPVDKPRVCCQCGKDLARKKRFKDSLGYWCEACHYSDKKAKRGDHVPCNVCGRLIAPDKQELFDGVEMCSRCYRQRKDEARKARRPAMIDHAYRGQEKRKVIGLAILAAILLVFIVLSILKMR